MSCLNLLTGYGRYNEPGPCRGGGGGGVATPGEEVPGSIPAVAARSLLVGSVSV